MEGWRKSSYSDGNGVISVRDTADRGGATMSDSDRRLEAIRGRA
jgi:hypothetical protein